MWKFDKYQPSQFILVVSKKMVEFGMAFKCLLDCFGSRKVRLKPNTTHLMFNPTCHVHHYLPQLPLLQPPTFTIIV